MKEKICRYNIQECADELEVGLEEIVKLYASYFDEMKAELSEMKRFLAEGNWVMLERVVHNVKGVSANLNIHDIYNEAAAFDTLLKINVTESAANFVEKIDQQLKSAENDIQSFFASNNLKI